MAALNEVAAAADEVPADTDVAWTGRTMKVPWFAEHMREELVLHGWDITGDANADARQARLAEPWMTTHSVIAVGRPLLAKGAKAAGAGRTHRGSTAGYRHRRRVRNADVDTTVPSSSADGPATLETDAAARVLLLWGRRPADPARICSRVGPAKLGPGPRQLLSGYCAVRLSSCYRPTATCWTSPTY